MDMLIAVSNTVGTWDLVGDSIGRIGGFVCNAIGTFVGDRIIGVGLSVGRFDDCCIGLRVGIQDGHLEAWSVGSMVIFTEGISVGGIPVEFTVGVGVEESDGFLLVPREGS